MQVKSRGATSRNRGTATGRSAGAVVLRGIRLAIEGSEGAAFVLRRARSEVGALPSTNERRILSKLLDAVTDTEPVDGGVVIAVLLAAYAAEAERARRLDEALEALRLARVLEPRSADLALRAARIARLQGRVQEAARLYARVRALDDGTGAWARLARIGEALVSSDPERELAVALRAAVRAGDAEAAALALEERAALREASGDVAGSVRDLCVAALRYGCARDRARVAHRLADLLSARGDRAGAREALLAALAAGDAEQQAYAMNRLHMHARAEGDELGMRRWRPGAAPLVALGPGRRAVAGYRSSLPRLRWWRDRLASAQSA